MRNMDSPSMIICRCEEITLQEIVETASRFRCSARELKLRTRAGMGFCGGRTCRMLVDAIVRQTAGEPAEPLPDAFSLTYRPPVRPVSFSELGGETPDERQN